MPPSDATPPDRAAHLTQLRRIAGEFVEVAHRSALAAARTLPRGYGRLEQRQAHLLVQVAHYLGEHAAAPDDELAAVARGVVDGLRAIGQLR